MTSSDPQHDPLSALNNLADGLANPDDAVEESAEQPVESQIADHGAAHEDGVAVAGPAEPNKQAMEQMAPRPVARPKVSEGFDLRWIVGGAMGLMGLLLLWPAIWALRVLVGDTSALPPGRSLDQARGMAFMMLVAWPIGLFLLAFGGLRLSQAMKALQGRRRSNASAD